MCSHNCTYWDHLQPSPPTVPSGFHSLCCTFLVPALHPRMKTKPSSQAQLVFISSPGSSSLSCSCMFSSLFNCSIVFVYWLFTISIVSLTKNIAFVTLFGFLWITFLLLGVGEFTGSLMYVGFHFHLVNQYSQLMHYIFLGHTMRVVLSVSSQP